MATRVFTIGHSTRTADDLIGLLREYGIRRLVDVRQYPGSRRFPHFNRDVLHARLAAEGIQYEWLADLGGRRRAGSNSGKESQGRSPNMGLRNAAFRNYADYMATPAFRAGVERLMDWARQMPTAMMCAEAVYWRCHRRLISDWLTIHGVEVLHILGPGQLRPHIMTEGAQAADDNVIYLPLARQETPGLFE